MNKWREEQQFSSRALSQGVAKFHIMIPFGRLFWEFYDDSYNCFTVVLHGYKKVATL